MKILFISLSNIGDAIMTTPVLNRLVDNYPDAEIDIVAGPRSADVFANFARPGKLFIKDKQGFLRGYYKLWRELVRNRYDLIVDLRFDGFSWLLRGNKRYTKITGPEKESQHAVLAHMAALPSSKDHEQDLETTIWLSENARNFATNALASLSSKRLIALGPGCGGPEKVWPADRFAAVCRELDQQFEAVVLLGGNGDQQYCSAVAAELQQDFVNLCGKTSITEAAAVIEKAGLFIGNDSGLGHLASAVKTPTATLFGVGYPKRYRPWQTRSVYLLGKEKEVQNITVEEVVKAINGMLQ